MIDVYHLQKPCLSLALDSTGRLRLIESPERGWTFLRASSAQARSLVLVWTAAGGAVPLHGWSWIPSETGSGLSLHGTLQGLELIIETSIEDNACIWRLQLANRGPDTVQRLRLQLAGPLTVGNSGWLTYPFNSGWCVPLAALGSDEVLALHYPVHASMQWADLYTPERGLYLGVHDPLPYYKTLLIGRVSGDPYLAWEFPDLCLEAGQVLDLPPIHLALHSGDWTAGASQYRSWAQKHISNPDVPAWYAQQPAWNWTFFRHQHAPAPANRCADLPEISARTASFGPQVIQLTAYNEHGHDTEYPDYAVGPSHGGDRDMSRAAAAIHAEGRHLAIYTNGRLVDPASSVSETERETWGVRAHPGAKVWQETYGQVIFDVMCPGAEPWRELFIHKLTHLVKRYNVDGIYVDQVCGCTSLPCYASGHQHERPNTAWAGYKTFVRALRQALRALKPTTYLATEGVNDMLGQHFDSQQSHEDWARDIQDRGRALPELYRYTFPRHLLNVGCIRANQPYYLRLGHTLGSGFDFGITEFQDLAPEFAHAARWVLEQRRRNDAILRKGTFHPQVHVDDEKYRANAFWHKDTLLIAAARLPEECEAPSRTIEICPAWPIDRRVAKAECESPWGVERCTVKQQNGQICVQVPGCKLTVVRLYTAPAR